MSSLPHHYHTTDDDDSWLQNLVRSGRPGKEFRDHLECVDYVLQNRNRTECPIQQVAHHRQVFCDAFARNERCFGLPSPTPRFVCLVNLSGYRAILYSKRAALVRLLCLVGPEASHRVMVNVERVIQYSYDHDCSVLCCFSLPWQSGVHAVHWEVRSLQRRADGTVRDGQATFSYTNEDVRVVAPTNEVDCIDPQVRAAQVEAMRRHFFAGNLDVEVDDVSAEGGEKAQALQSIVAALKSDRGRLLADLATEKNERVVALKEAERHADERVGKVANAAMTAEATMRLRVAETESHVRTLREQNAALEKRNADLVREKASQDLEFGGLKTKLQNRAKLAEAASRASQEKLNSFTQSNQRERESLDRGHVKQTEDLERRLQENVVRLRQAERRLEEQIDATRRLGEVCDQLRTEKQTLHFEIKGNAQTNRSESAKILALRCALAVAKQRLESAQGAEAARLELVQMLAAAEGAAHAAETSVETLRSEVSELTKAAEEKAAKEEAEAKEEAANQEAETAETASTRAWQPAEESKLPEGLPPSSWIAEREMITAEMNTEPAQDPAELTELRVEVGRLNTEKEAWEAEERKLRDQLAHAAHATGDTSGKNSTCVNVFPPLPASGWSNGAIQPPVDLGVDPNSTDLGVETVVGQAQLAMRALSDMARAGQQARAASENLWSELSALKRFTNVGEAWQQQGFYTECCPPTMQWVPMQPQMVVPTMPMQQQQSPPLPPPPMSAAPHARNGNARRGAR